MRGKTRCSSWPASGYRCIAHDRRGHGRSSQPWNGNDMDTYADDLAALVEALDLKNADPRRPLHRRRRSRPLHRPPWHQARGQGRADQRRAAADAEDRRESRRAADGGRSTRSAPPSSPTARSSSRISALPFYGANRPGAKVSQGLRDSFWLQGMMAGHKAVVRLHQGVFRNRLHRRSEEVRRADPDPARRRRSDRADRTRRRSPPSSSRRDAEGLSRLPARHVLDQKDQINADLLAFLKG